MKRRWVGLVAGVLLAPVVSAQDLSYAAISARYSAAIMNDANYDLMRAEGECLAGIKELNSLPPDEFQPNIEWLRIRTQALLTLARPCDVLVMLEAAHAALHTAKAQPRTAAVSE
jgi:hypothetical protein